MGLANQRHVWEIVKRREEESTSEVPVLLVIEHNHGRAGLFYNNISQGPSDKYLVS